MTTSATAPSSSRTRDYEPGYRGAVIREDTKIRLQQFRRSLGDRKDLAQEKRLITAAVDYMLSRPELAEDWLRQVNEVVRRDMDSRDAMAG
jgi:hypothetical protein